MPVTDPPTDTIKELADALNIVLLDRKITRADVEQRLQILSDVFDSSAVLDEQAIRRALRFDKIFTVKAWTVEVDERLHNAAMREQMEKDIQLGVWPFQTKPDTSCTWHAFNRWLAKYPSNPTGTSVRHRKLGTVRVQNTTASGNRIRNELERNLRFAADFRLLMAFLGKYFRHLKRDRPLMIVPTDAFDREDNPREQLLVRWDGYSLRAEILTRGVGQGTLPWTNADLLIQGQI